MYCMADGEFDLTVWHLLHLLISINMNFLDTVQNGVLSFRQIKIRHIFKNVIWRHFIELNSCQTFQPYSPVLAIRISVV